MPFIFLNGSAMQGGPLHHQLHGAPLIRRARTAPKYQFFSVANRFPAMHPVPANGHRVHGEVYDITLETLHNHLLPAEPEELELGTIELSDGTTCLATILRRQNLNSPHLIDISHIGDWPAYLATLTP
ncbi:MAG TPA: gamma-glutamylcyclotransferase [Pseudonocardiaceae bacterium]|nr:gamma-glutamylcyclotransferase [Pseudonocardiaceae bacterium]